MRNSPRAWPGERNLASRLVWIDLDEVCAVRVCQVGSVEPYGPPGFDAIQILISWKTIDMNSVSAGSSIDDLVCRDLEVGTRRLTHRLAVQRNDRG